MAVLTSILGWSAFGLGTRCYALGIQKRYVFENLGVHAMFMGVGGAFGYAMFHVEERQEELLANVKKRIQFQKQHKAERLEERQAEREGNGGH